MCRLGSLAANVTSHFPEYLGQCRCLARWTAKSWNCPQSRRKKTDRLTASTSLPPVKAKATSSQTSGSCPPPASLPRQEVPHVPVLGVSVQIIIRVRPVLRRNGVFRWFRGGLANAGLWCSSGPRAVAAQVRIVAECGVVGDNRSMPTLLYFFRKNGIQNIT